MAKKNKSLIKKIGKCLVRIKNNPFDPPLNTHKVNSKNFGFKYFSSITAGLLFILNFDENTEELEIIEILDIGGHSGSNSAY